MEENLKELMEKLKKLGIDSGDFENQEIYVGELKAFVNSMDFMRLGQAINHEQWQAAAMKASKMSAEAKRLRMTRLERPFTAIRQNINRKNKREALQALAVITSLRVDLLKILGFC